MENAVANSVGNKLDISWDLGDSVCLETIEKNTQDILIEELQNWLTIAQLQHCATEVLGNKLPQVANKVEEAIKEISQRFVEVEKNVRQQSETISELAEVASHLDFDNQHISMEAFTHIFSETLDDAISKILFVSKQAIKMVYTLDEAMSNLAFIEEFVREIKDITRKANMLALNANIEATRVGELGNGFRLVADEVRIVSETINQAANSITQRIESINESVQVGYSLLKDVATTDLSSNIKAQERMSSLLLGLLEQKENLAKIIAKSQTTSSKNVGSIADISARLQAQGKIHGFVRSGIMLLQAVDKSLHDMSQNSKNLIHETYKVSFPKEMVEAAIS